MVKPRRRRWFVQGGIASVLLGLAGWLGTGQSTSAPAPVPAGSTAPAATPAAELAPGDAPAIAESASPAGAEASVEEDGPLLSGTPPSAREWSERYFPFLEDESEQGSISVGDTSHGYLISARKIQESEALGILTRQRGRDLGYGTDQIVMLLEETAQRFRERTGTRLWIGNVGRRGGGDIAFSVSHNSGRDADVALAYSDAKGAPVEPPDLVSVDAAGLSRDKEHRYRFDIGRSWQIVKALVESDKAQIEFLFLARPLSEKLLRHAREKKEPVQLIERAAALLYQPGGAPHDDHLHVRVYCSERDVEGGCLNTGPLRPWVKRHGAARAGRIEKAAAALGHGSAEQRARGIERLVLLQARDHQDSIASKLDDSEPRVRAAAAQALGRWGGGAEANRLAMKLGSESEPVARAAMMAALSELGGPAAGELFAAELGRAGTVEWGSITGAAAYPASPAPLSLLAEVLAPMPLLLPELGVLGSAPGEPAFAMKLYIIDAAGFCDRPEPVEPLFSLLGDRDSTIRARAAQALSRLLNRRLDGQIANPDVAVEARLKAVNALAAQVSPLRRTDRSPWIALGFSRAGFKVPAISAEHAWEILRAFSAGEPYSYNAARALGRIALGTAEPEEGKKPERPPDFEETLAECRYWLKWIDSHRGKLHLAKAPENIAAACK